jgi:ring-1,2-phenylacetyl-CoA epoxidase subunit PaaD
MPATSPTLDQIWNWLEEVVDPELPVVSVVDLGIVRELNWCEDQGESKLIVTITPTYSGCPATTVIKRDIGIALRERGITNVQIETQLAPAWTTDWLSEQGRRRLREYGIAPPQRFHRNSEQSVAEEARPSVPGQTVSGSSPPCCGESYAESEAAIECPCCGSKNTRMVSQFGSTPCKAFYVCDACREPFDYFKCH